MQSNFIIINNKSDLENAIKGKNAKQIWENEKEFVKMYHVDNKSLCHV